MPAVKNAYIQVAPNSSGSKVLNLEMVIVDPMTGAESTVEVQGVMLLRPSGEYAETDVTAFTAAMVEATAILKDIRTLMEKVASGPTALVHNKKE